MERERADWILKGVVNDVILRADRETADILGIDNAIRALQECQKTAQGTPKKELDLRIQALSS